MVWPILISVAVTPGDIAARCAGAKHGGQPAGVLRRFRFPTTYDEHIMTLLGTVFVSNAAGGGVVSQRIRLFLGAGGAAGAIRRRTEKMEKPKNSQILAVNPFHQPILADRVSWWGEVLIRSPAATTAVRGP